MRQSVVKTETKSLLFDSRGVSGSEKPVPNFVEDEYLGVLAKTR